MRTHESDNFVLTRFTIRSSYCSESIVLGSDVHEPSGLTMDTDPWDSQRTSRTRGSNTVTLRGLSGSGSLLLPPLFHAHIPTIPHRQTYLGQTTRF